MERVLGCNQSKQPQHSFVCSVAPEDTQLPLILSFWCSIDLVITFFFLSPLHTDPHEDFNFYTPGQLFGINLSLILHKIFFKLEPVLNDTLNPNFCISFLILGPIFGIQRMVIVVVKHGQEKVLNSDNGNFVKTNAWKPLLRKMKTLH